MASTRYASSAVYVSSSSGNHVLMNVETDKKTLDELTGSFRFSDAVIRHLVVSMPAAVTEPSPMAREEEEGARSEDVRPHGGDDDSIAAD